MIARGHLLIAQQLANFERQLPWGINLEQVSASEFLTWIAKIRGLIGTHWEGGIFRVYLKFNENLDKKPPKIYFHTIPFHPNIDMVTGRPCIAFLDDPKIWNEHCQLTEALIHIQALLCDPSLHNPVNLKAAKMLQDNPALYYEMVHNCVIASQKLEEKLYKMLSITKDEVSRREVPDTKRRTCISFQDYHEHWLNLATSTSFIPQSHNYLKDLIHDTVSAPDDPTSVRQRKDDKKKILDNHYALVYGINNNNDPAIQSNLSKIQLINKMRQLYINGSPDDGARANQTPAVSFVTDISNTNSPDANQRAEVVSLEEDDINEQEVDDLIAWSNSLDIDVADDV